MPERYTPGVRLRLEMGRYVLAEDYVRAMAGRQVLMREVDAALAQHDALVVPTLPIPAPTIGATTVRIAGRDEPVRSVMLRLTQLFDVTGHPAVSIPSAPSATPHGGLPCGLQLVGCRHETDALLRVALACERYITAS
jgi:aspartyl-tRNA(Asn)/glutamyl-tRNA(Gln) amidotransferase subunit A